MSMQKISSYAVICYDARSQVSRSFRFYAGSSCRALTNHNVYWGIIVCPNLGEGIPFQSFSGGQDPCPTLHEKFLSGSDCLTSCLSNARSWHSQFGHMSNMSIHITSFLFEHRRQPLKAAALCTVRNEPLATVHDCATMNSLADSYTGSTNCGGSYWRPDFVNPLYKLKLKNTCSENFYPLNLAATACVLRIHQSPISVCQRKNTNKIKQELITNKSYKSSSLDSALAEWATLDRLRHRNSGYSIFCRWLPGCQHACQVHQLGHSDL